MELNKILNGVTTLHQLKDENLSINVAVKLSKNLEEIQRALEIFEKRRKEIIAPLGKDPEKASQKDQEAAEAEVNKLLEEDIEITIIKLTLDELSEVKISAASIGTIMWMIEEEENGN